MQDIWGIFKASAIEAGVNFYGVVKHCFFTSLISFGFFWVLLIAVLSNLRYQWTEAFVLILILVLWLNFICAGVSVNIHRLFLIEGEKPRWAPFQFSLKLAFEFFAYFTLIMLSIYLITTAIQYWVGSVIYLLPGFQGSFSEIAIGPMRHYWLISNVVAGFVTSYWFLRVAIVFPSIAIGNRIDLLEAWRFGKNHTTTLVILALCFVLGSWLFYELALFILGFYAKIKGFWRFLFNLTLLLMIYYIFAFQLAIITNLYRKYAASQTDKPILIA